METKIYFLGQGECEDNQAIGQAGEFLRQGGLVAFPTETVYGLGGDAFNPASARKIYEAKGRPSDNPLIVHISHPQSMERLAEEIPPEAYALAGAFWPGPLTLILKKKPEVPSETTGGLPTVAIRLPADRTALALIEAGGGFVAAPSANRSGRPSPTAARFVIEDMEGRAEMILAGEDSHIGLESTIVDLTVSPPLILRPGFITPAMLGKVIGKAETDPALLDGDVKGPPRAPGMRYRHYAPRGELRIIRGKETAVIQRINALVEKARREGKKSGVICTVETAESYLADSVKSVGGRGDEKAIGRSLYRLLREFDEEKIQAIFSECFFGPGEGAAGQGEKGQAVMNRLLKAAGCRIETA